MANKKKQEKSILKGHKKIVIFSTIITIIVLTFILQTFSKYVLKKQNFQAVVATRFYFESDLLSADGKNNDFYDWDGKSIYELEFNIMNYEDVLRYGSQDISYTVDVENNSNVNVKCFINEIETNNGVLTKGKQTSDKVKLTIEPNSVIANKESINVSVTSNSPYSKTLNGVFNININKKEYTANLIEKKDYEKLIITTYDYNKTLKIEYEPTKLMLYTDGLNNNDNIITINPKSNSNYEIEFIKLTSDEIKLNTDVRIIESN